MATDDGSSKRTGLEKALHQVEQAVRRSGPGQGIEAAKVVSELKALLAAGANSNGSLPDSQKSPVANNSNNHNHVHNNNHNHNHNHNRPSTGRSDIILPDASSDAGDSSGSEMDAMSAPQESTPSQSHVAEESLAIDDAENPLQLLARASDLHVSPKGGNEHIPAESLSHQRSRLAKQSDKISEVEKFFQLTQFSLDIGPDLDPIDLGLITTEEADSLFAL